ncbi:MAG TPA: Stp1/IreP family PP2C-type Ser/Thr phosphatase [Solirubrobacteraceae bacterium]|nr:Stp1/IreP family PP2C-type Ser/Thr phosphatase [Solirubrobacteraceae bacterium]
MLRAADSVWKTDTGRQRRDNEDSAYVRVPLYVVADGMGGAQAGEVASALAVEEFQRGLPDSDADHPTAEQRLAARVRDANRRIYETAQAEREHSGMGTTLTAVYVDGADLAIAHVGDSRAYVLRDGELTRLTHDHSLVEELMRRGKLTPEQAAEHPQRSIITRALGIEPDVEVDTWTYPGRAGDVVLLCSDGLTSMIDEDQVAQVLRSEPDLDRAGERLIAAANEAGGRDNITVVLFRLVETEDERQEDPGETVVGLQRDDELISPREPDAAAAYGSADPPTAQMTVAPPVITRDQTGSRPAPRLARTQGRPQKKRGRRGREPGQGPLFKLGAALFSIAVVLFLFGGGGYLATRELFFVGTNSDGIVTLYSGLPYDFIVPFYEQSYVSGLPASEVPKADRAQLFNHDLHSQTQAIAIIRQAELGHYPKVK